MIRLVVLIQGRLISIPYKIPCSQRLCIYVFRYNTGYGSRELDLWTAGREMDAGGRNPAPFI